MRVRRSSRAVRGGAGALGLVLLAGSASAQSAPQPLLACAPPAAAHYLVERFRDDVLTQDSTSLRMWPEGIPLPEPAAIMAEIDPVVCDRVLRAYFASIGHTGPYREAGAIVVRLGRAFAVEDPGNRAGEWQIVEFLTPELEVVAGWLH